MVSHVVLLAKRRKGALPVGGKDRGLIKGFGLPYRLQGALAPRIQATG